MSTVKYILALTTLLLAFGLVHRDWADPFSAVQDGLTPDSSAVKIKLVPPDILVLSKGKPYKFTDRVRVRIVVTNHSNAAIRALLQDTYYQNRPKLYKDHHLVPYRQEIAKLVVSKDTDPQFVRVGSTVVLEPTTTTDLEELNLSDWYDPLKPGSYRLINRHRFALDGPWSDDSEELLFEVAE